MSNTTLLAPVKPPVEAERSSTFPLSVPIPAWIVRRFVEIARVADIDLPDLICEEVGEQVLCRGRHDGMMGSLADELGNFVFTAEERKQLMEDFGALCDRFDKDPDGPGCENPSMVQLVVVPVGKTVVLLNERTGRYLSACCATAGVDPEQYVEEWAAKIVHDSLGGALDVDKSGVTYDVVEEFPRDEERTADERAGLYEVMRGLAFEYQQELKQEAAASVDGGVK